MPLESSRFAIERHFSIKRFGKMTLIKRLEILMDCREIKGCKDRHSRAINTKRKVFRSCRHEIDHKVWAGDRKPV
ncbi:hypothetical protein [Rhabdaerophilum sp. SD176]|uniref:hypothetical protein n=1 Tax=Rhabdaerophilum sp. SD176 TaxID=2983548 RepID=UPI0024DF3B90|nr:hypothetical protein [Rhabdaerophilum sp. SD176]